MRSIVKALDEGGVDAVRGSPMATGCPALVSITASARPRDWEWIEAAADVLKRAVLTTLILPGRGVPSTS